MCCEIGRILKFIQKFVKNVVCILVADICSLPNSLLYPKKKKKRKKKKTNKGMNYYRVYNSSLSFCEI